MGFRKFIGKTFEDATENYEDVLHAIFSIIVAIVITCILTAVAYACYVKLFRPHWRGCLIAFSVLVGFFLSPFIFTVPASVFRQIKNKLKRRG